LKRNYFADLAAIATTMLLFDLPTSLFSFTLLITTLAFVVFSASFSSFTSSSSFSSKSFFFFLFFHVAFPQVHAYLTRRTDMSGRSVLAAGDKFVLSFPRPDRLDGVSSDTKSVLRCSAVTFAYPPKEGQAAAGALAASDEGEASNGDKHLRVVLRNVDCRLTLRSKVGRGSVPTVQLNN